MVGNEPVNPAKAVKINKLIFFGINFLLLIPALLRNASPVGLAGAGVILAIGLACIMASGGSSVPACAYLPPLLFLDFCAGVCLHYEALIKNFAPERFSQAVEAYSERPLCIGLLLAGAAAGIVGIRKPPLSWLTAVSGGFIGASVILVSQSNGQVENFLIYSGGKALLAMLLIGVLIWMLAFQIAAITASETRRRNILLGVLLLCGMAAIYISEYSLLLPTFLGLSQWLLALPGTLFAWENIFLSCTVLLVTAAAIARIGGGRPGVDAVVLLICGILIFAIKFLMSNYFMGSWALLLILVLCMLRVLKSEAEGTAGLPSVARLGIQAAIFLLIAKAVQNGLYANILLAAVFALAVHMQRKKMGREKFRNFLSAALIAFFVAEALAWQWRMRSSPEGAAMLAVTGLVAAATLLAASFPRPDRQDARSYPHICLCVCTALLCLASMRPTISVTVETRGQDAVISVMTEDGRPAAEASYYWSDYPGQEAEGGRALVRTSTTVPIRGNILTVVALDADGVRTSRIFWYPPWQSQL